jgi:hypothetical protein
MSERIRVNLYDGNEHPMIVSDLEGRRLDHRSLLRSQFPMPQRTPVRSFDLTAADYLRLLPGLEQVSAVSSGSQELMADYNKEVNAISRRYDAERQRIRIEELAQMNTARDKYDAGVRRLRLGELSDKLSSYDLKQSA